MADFDDDRPGDDPSGDPPKGGTGGLRRFAPRRRRPEEPYPPDGEGTGEVPRPASRSARPAPPPEDDLDFSTFDDEPAPPRPRASGARSARADRPRRGSRGGGGSGRGGSRGGGGGGGAGAILQQPRARLILAIAFAAILILVITLVVRDCQRNQLEDSYTEYLNGVATITTQSAEQGKQLRQIINNPRGDNPPQLTQKIRALAGEASGLVDEAEDLDPPGELSSPQRSLIQTLDYRVLGMSTLADNLPALLQSKDQQTKSIGLAQPMRILGSSDTIYDVSFVGPAGEALRKDDITGIEVPPGQPFLPNPALQTPEGAATLIAGLQRTGPAQGGDADAGGAGNLRGTSLVSTEALPSETRLTPGAPQAVQASDQLKWRVTVENGGDFNETGIVVKASFFYPSDPNTVDEKETSIEELGSGQTTTVEIPGPTTPVFGEQGTLKIEIDAVSGETNTDNNAAEYPVKITI
jgi:hypothetical protein